MTMEAPHRDAEALVEELNSLIEELEQHPDTELREKSLELMQTALELYGEALRRITQALESLPQKSEIMSRLYGDEVVRAVLLIHGLAPLELRERVAAAIEHLRPYLISQGCDVELTAVEGGRARVRLIRSGQGGAPPVLIIKQEIEKALTAVAPDLAGVDVEGIAEQMEATAKAAAVLGRLATPKRESEATAAATLVQIKRQPHAAAGPWVAIVRSIGFEDGKFAIVRQADLDVLVCKSGGEFYAYKNTCAAAPECPLDDAVLDDPMLTCSCHGYQYDLRRNSCIERPDLQLESLPLKVEDDKVKVAFGGKEIKNAG